MRSRKLLSKTSTIVIIALAVLILSLLVTISNQRQNQLPAYQEIESSALPESSTMPDIELTQYTSDVLPYSMSVPAAWTYIEADAPSFVHAADGATIQFFHMAYDPAINMITRDSLAKDIAGANGTLVDFSAPSASSYLSLYEVSGIYYLEYTVWDHSDIVRVVFMYSGENASYYTALANQLLGTFTWEQSDPIPNGYYIYYSEFGNFEFGVPLAWEAYVDNGVFTAVSPERSYMTCTVTQSEAAIGQITVEQFVQIYLPDVSEYQVITFQNTGTTITAEIGYWADGMEYRLVSNVLASNGYIYEFAFLSSADAYREDGANYIQSIELFQVFS